MTPSDIIAAARIRALNKHPYIADVLLSLRPIARPGMAQEGPGPLGVDRGWRLFYDPAVVSEWGVGTEGRGHDGITAVLIHETWHCLVDSLGRRHDRDADRWNRAEDRAINDDIVRAGWKLPGSPLMPAGLGMRDGLAGEEYYEKEPVPPAGSGGGAVLLVPGCGGRCGGCAGNPPPGEEGGGSEGPAGAPPISGPAQQVIRRQAALNIVAAAKAGRGDVPAGLQRWAAEHLEPPRIDWRHKLAALVRGAVADRAGAVNYSYSRPARRQWGMRLVLGGRAPVMPALRCPIPNVALCLDVSGSMLGQAGKSPIAAARSEVLGIVRAIGCPVLTYAVDTQVAGRRRVGSIGDLEQLGETGGGTDMRVGIAELVKLRPDIVIVLTDGYTPWPAYGEIRTRLLAVITPGGEVPPAHIPFVAIDDFEEDGDGD